MVWRTNERLTRGNEIPKKICRPLQGSGELQEREVPFSIGGGADEREGRGCRVVVLQVAFSRDIVVGAKEVVEEIGLEEEGGRKSGKGRSFCLVTLGRE